MTKKAIKEMIFAQLDEDGQQVFNNLMKDRSFVRAMKEMIKRNEEPQEFKAILDHIAEVNNTPGDELKADEMDLKSKFTPKGAAGRGRGRRDRD